jgi:hypothetical protein
MPGVDHAAGAIHDRDRGHGGVFDEGQQAARNRDGIARANGRQNGIGGVRGYAARASAQLQVDILTCGGFGHRTQVARVRIMRPDQEHGDRGHCHKDGREGRTRIFELQTEGSHWTFFGRRNADRLPHNI